MDFTQREIPYGQNPNYTEVDKRKQNIEKIRPETKGSTQVSSDTFYRERLKNTNMSKSIDDGSTTNEVNTRIKNLDVKDFSTDFAADIGYQKIIGGVNQIGDFYTEDNLSDGGVEKLNTQTLTDGSFFESFGKAAGRTAIASIPGFNAVADIVNTFYPRDPKGLGKAMVGVDGLKDKAANTKEVPSPGKITLNDNENFPLGTIESNRFGPLHGDKTVDKLNGLKKDPVKNLGNLLSNAGLDIAANAIGMLNNLTGRSISDEIDFWRLDSDALDNLEAKEMQALQSVDTQNIYNEKPGKYIKPMRDNTFREEYLKKVFNYSKDEDEDEVFFNKRFNRNSIGYVYVEPYFSSYSGSDEKSGGIQVFTIPFQFNPEISEGNISAKYTTEEILGRITAARYYINTDSGTTTIKTKYIATNQNHNVDEINGRPRKNYGDLDSDWYEFWTPERVREMEYKYRSLVFPTRQSNGYLVKPPIVQVYISNEQLPTIANVLAYPIAQNEEILNEGSGKSVSESSYVTYRNEEVFSYTKSFADSQVTKDDNGNIVGGTGTAKRFVVTDVKIEDLENTNGWNYDRVEGYKRGFSVTITLAETTRNFLDQVPDFRAYYDAFVNSKQVDENYYKGVEDKYISGNAQKVAKFAEEAGRKKDIADKDAKDAKTEENKLENTKANGEAQIEEKEKQKEGPEAENKRLESEVKDKEERIKDDQKKIKEERKEKQKLEKQQKKIRDEYGKLKPGEDFKQKHDELFEKDLELQRKINEKSNEIYKLELDASSTQININNLNEIIGANNTLINSINDDISAINKGIADQAKATADAKARADKSQKIYEDFKNNAQGFFFQ